VSAVRRRKAAAPPGPFLRFRHSQELRDRTLAVLSELESAADAVKHRKALADVIVELTDTGLDYFFIQPLKVARAGFVAEAAELGMAGAKQVLGAAVRNIVSRMDGPQLLSLCASIRQFML
jgi:hypothetical protein